jgi:outer membrane lipoprotein-sorting protein
MVKEYLRRAKDNILRQAKDNILRQAKDNILRQAQDDRRRQAQDDRRLRAKDNILRRAKDNRLLRSCVVILIFSLTALNIQSGFSQSKKDSVYKDLVGIYKHTAQVSFNFNLLEENFKGTLTAKKGNKYKMVVGDRIIICNGKSIWNYSPKDNKVVISNFEDSKDQVSIEELFFSFLLNFEPVKITEQVVNKNQTIFILSLKPKKNFKTMHEINSVDIWIDSGTYDILKFHITEPQEMTWVISKLRLRKSADDSIFEFEPNNECTVIDLR